MVFPILYHTLEQIPLHHLPSRFVLGAAIFCGEVRPGWSWTDHFFTSYTTYFRQQPDGDQSVETVRGRHRPAGAAWAGFFLSKDLTPSRSTHGSHSDGNQGGGELRFDKTSN